MSHSELYRKWFKRYIQAIHRHDQCQAMADELASKGNPKSQGVRRLQEAYAFFGKIASERVAHYRKAARRK